MIVPIEINSDDIVEQFSSITSNDIDTMFDNIAKALALNYYQRLEGVAAQSLHSTRRRYIQNIRLVDTGKMEGTVILDFSKDPLVRMIELGATPFDMKVDMLKSVKAKTSSSGKKYLTIPFRWATPSALGESELFSGKMPSSVYKVAKKLEVNTSSMNSQGLRSSMLPKKHQKLGVRKSIQNNENIELFKEYTHKTSIYEGIRKQQDSTTGQNSYYSFRRVSELSDPDSFIHPGITAKNLMKEALEGMDIENQVGPLIDNELEKMGLI